MHHQAVRQPEALASALEGQRRPTGYSACAARRRTLARARTAAGSAPAVRWRAAAQDRQVDTVGVVRGGLQSAAGRSSAARARCLVIEAARAAVARAARAGSSHALGQSRSACRAPHGAPRLDDQAGRRLQAEVDGLGYGVSRITSTPASASVSWKGMRCTRPGPARRRGRARPRRC